jgi:hypothetical protein
MTGFPEGEFIACSQRAPFETTKVRAKIGRPTSKNRNNFNAAGNRQPNPAARFCWTNR